MITLTTLQADRTGAMRQGIAMFVDGQLAAEMSSSLQYLGERRTNATYLPVPGRRDGQYRPWVASPAQS